jgi:cell division protein FtsL
MSTRTATRRQPASPKVRESNRPKLRVIDQRRVREAAFRRRLVLGSALLLVAGMFVSALAQAELVRGQQEINDLRQQVSVAGDQKAALERQIVVASAPQAIVERARAMGMVRAADPQYFSAVRVADRP